MATSFAVSHQEIRIGAYSVSVKQRLAEGGFGFVDLVYEQSSRSDFVLKRCGIQNIESLDIVKREINMLQTFSGPYLVKLLADDMVTTAKGTREALLLLEFCPGGHLLERLLARNGQHLAQSAVLKIFGQLCLALKPLHEYNPPVTHRDLKLENILFGSDGNLRLCDFGSCVVGPVYINSQEARANAEEAIQKTTTQMYRSPELVDLYMRDVLTEKSDIWALGCILYALCFLKHPFQDAGNLGISNGLSKMPENSAVSADCRTLITRIFDLDPEARPSVSQLFDAVSALSRNEPLPAFEVSAEAVMRREERRNRELIREQKAKEKHKTQPVVPHRTPVALDVNSVAYKRLLDKGKVKGGIPSGNFTTKSVINNNSDIFDPFGSSSDSFGPSSSSIEANIFGVSSGGGSRNPTSDLFFASAPTTSIESADSFFEDTDFTDNTHQTVDAGFNNFGSNDAFENTSSFAVSNSADVFPTSSENNNFDPFSISSTSFPSSLTTSPPTSTVTDPFAATPPLSTSTATVFDPFAPSDSVTSNGFDGFEGSAPSNAADPFSSGPTPAFISAGSIFDTLDNNIAIAPPSNTSFNHNTSNNTFDNFSSSSIKVDPLLEPFDSINLNATNGNRRKSLTGDQIIGMIPVNPNPVNPNIVNSRVRTNSGSLSSYAGVGTSAASLDPFSSLQSAAGLPVRKADTIAPVPGMGQSNTAGQVRPTYTGSTSTPYGVMGTPAPFNMGVSNMGAMGNMNYNTRPQNVPGNANSGKKGPEKDPFSGLAKF